MNISILRNLIFLYLLSFVIVHSSCTENSSTTTADKEAVETPQMKRYCLENPPVIGVTDEVTFYEGGFSGLHYIPGTDLEFYAINDRGPNFNVSGHPFAEGQYVKLFSFPDYSQKIIHLKVVDNELQVLGMKSLVSGTNRSTTGLPVPGMWGENQEIAWSDLEGTHAGYDSLGLDAEGIAIDTEGNFWLADEYRTSIWRVNWESMEIMDVYSPIPVPESVIPIDEVYKKRRPNRGFEGVASAPDGKIYAVLQSPLWNPGKSMRDESRIIRLLQLDPKTNETQSYAYLMRNKKGDIRLRNWKIGDMVAVNNHQFLILDHASRKGDQYFDVYLIDISEADPLPKGRVNGKTVEQLLDREGLKNAGIKHVKKTHLFNLLDLGYDGSHDKPEGIAIIDSRTIAVVNDNDYGMDIDSDQWKIQNNGIQSCLYLITLPEGMELELLRD